ncbi:MAG: hypothetical protein WA397_17425 [Roseiarcus sp.]
MRHQHGGGDARIALDNQPLRKGDRDADLHRVGAIEGSARFLGASGRNTDPGFADRDLFWARAIEDALVVRFRRLQARREDVNVLGERPAIERDQNTAGFDMVAVRDVDRLHDAAARDAERQGARLRLRLRAGSVCRKREQKRERETEAVS